MEEGASRDATQRATDEVDPSVLESADISMSDRIREIEAQQDGWVQGATGYVCAEEERRRKEEERKEASVKEQRKARSVTKRTASRADAREDGEADGDAKEGVASLWLGGGRLEHNKVEQEGPEPFHNDRTEQRHVGGGRDAEGLGEDGPLEHTSKESGHNLDADVDGSIQGCDFVPSAHPHRDRDGGIVVGTRQMATCIDDRNEAGTYAEGGLHLKDVVAPQKIDQIEGDRCRQEESPNELDYEGRQSLGHFV